VFGEHQDLCFGPLRSGDNVINLAATVVGKFRMDMEIGANCREWTRWGRWIAFCLVAMDHIPHPSQVIFGQFLYRIFPNARRKGQ
jgi:hypothetical protein